MKKAFLRRWIAAAALMPAACGKPEPPPSPAVAKEAAPEPLPATSPRDAWEARRRAWLEGDARAVWESLCSASRDAKIRTQERAMEELRRLDDPALERALQPYALAPGRFRRMSAEEMCLYMIAGTVQVPEATKARLRAQEFRGAEVQGRTAVCTIVSVDGASETLVLVAEGGAWKVDDAETARRRGAAPRR